MTAFLARFSLECLAYIRFHPCACGSEEAVDVKIRIRDSQSLAIYDGPCTSCGQRRFFEFVIGTNDDDPSSIVDAGQWLLTAERYARLVPADLDEVNADNRVAAVTCLAYAITALEEALKFIGDDEYRVSETALFTAEGRALYAQEPGRFRRVRIAAVLGAYRDSAAEGGGPEGPTGVDLAG